MTKLETPAELKYSNVLATSIRAILERTENVADLETVIGDVDLATGEIFTNLVKHAYVDLDGVIEIEIWVNSTSSQLVIRFWDQGDSFEFKPDQILLSDPSELSGRGLFLVLQLMDKVIYTSADQNKQINKNCWRLTKNLS